MTLSSSQVYFGNAERDGTRRKDGSPSYWFIGQLEQWAKEQSQPFVKEAAGIRQTSDVKVKWGIHRAEEERKEWTKPNDQASMSILISGKFEIRFREPDGSERIHTLAEQGDYVMWSETVPHTWKTLEDSIVLTVRWKEPGT